MSTIAQKMTNREILSNFIYVSWRAWRSFRCALLGGKPSLDTTRFGRLMIVAFYTAKEEDSNKIYLFYYSKKEEEVKMQL